MPLLRAFSGLLRRTAGLPLWLRYFLTTQFVLVALLVREAFASVWPTNNAPFMLMFYAVAASAALGTGGAGYFATAISTVISFAYIPRSGGLVYVRPDWIIPVCAFAAFGVGITALIETLHHATVELRAALAGLHETERRRALLLREYRHRTRNDLMAINALLLLRARHVGEGDARQALREAAAHTIALGKIHSRLEDVTHDREHVAIVDVCNFLLGVCLDLVPPLSAICISRHMISTERAINLGLLVTEMVQDARHDGADIVMVQFERVGDDFMLEVRDDRPHLDPGEVDTLRSRLVRVLAVQLRGTVARMVNEVGGGLTRTVRFPVVAPGLS